MWCLHKTYTMYNNLLYFAWTDQRVQQFMTTIMCKVSTYWGKPEQASITWRMAWLSIHKEPWRKNEIATHYCNLVWWFMYKHDKLTAKCKIFGFVYQHSILGWYGQPFHKNLNGKDYNHSILGLVWSIMPWWIKQQRLLTLCSFSMRSGHHHQQDRLRIMHLARRLQDTRLRRYTSGHGLSCSSNFIYCTPHGYGSCCPVYKHSAASGSLHDAASICLV